MPAPLRNSPNDLAALTAATAETTGLPLEFVEKDFWVVELLRSVTRTLPDLGASEQPTMVFKGGTSLSKALRLTRRFSEDVDILVLPPDGTSKNGIEKRILKPVTDRVLVDLGLGEGAAQAVTATKGVKRYTRYLYPAAHAAGRTSEGVLLEMGVRGGTLPGLEPHRVHSYIADYLKAIGEGGQFEEEEPVEVLVLSPLRTLAEKLSAVHTAAVALQQGDFGADVRGRHLYDIHALLTDPNIHADLAGCDWTAICAEVAENSIEFGWPHHPRPAGGYAESPAFARAGPVFDRCEAAYDESRNLVFGAMPRFIEVLDAVRRNRGAL